MNPFMSDIQVSPVLKSICFNNWDEWMIVREGLFANHSPNQQQHALQMVNMWRLRGNLPHSVDSTANFVEIRLNDPLFQLASDKETMKDSSSSSSSSSTSATSLRMLYSMAIIRAVNGLVDPGQQSYFAQSVLVLAEKLGLPGWIVELRHDGTHKQLPSMTVLRAAAQYMIDWYDRNYWTPQFNNIQALMKFCFTPMVDPSCIKPLTIAGNDSQKLAQQRSQWMDALLKNCNSPGFISDIFLPIFIDAITMTCENFQEEQAIEAIFQQTQLPLWRPVLDTFSSLHSHLWYYSAITRLISTFAQLLKQSIHSTVQVCMRKVDLLSKWIIYMLEQLQHQINATTVFKSPLEVSRFGLISTAIKTTNVDLSLQKEEDKCTAAVGDEVAYQKLMTTWSDIQLAVSNFQTFLEGVNSNVSGKIINSNVSSSDKCSGSSSKKRKFDKVKGGSTSDVNVSNVSNAVTSASSEIEGPTKISYETLMSQTTPVTEVVICDDFPIWSIGYWPGEYNCRSLLSLEIVKDS